MRVGAVANSIEHFKYSWPEMALGLRDNGVEAVFAAGDCGMINEHDSVTKLDGLTRRPDLRSIRSFKSIRAWIDRENLDCILVNTAVPATLVRLAAGNRVPVIYFAHGLHWGSNVSLRALPWQIIEGALTKRTAGAIVLNSDDEVWFKKAAPLLPTHRLEYGVGVDIEKFRPETLGARKSDDHELSLVWIGEFSRRKQPIRAIEVVERLKDRGVPAHLRMLGDGPLLEQAKSTVREKRLSGVVSFEGKTDPLPHYYDAHALIHTATWEGYPRVFLEALAVGRRVIAFDAKGTRDLPGVTTVEKDNVSKMADLLRLEWRSGDITLAPDVDRSRLSSFAAGREIGQFLSKVLG